MKLKNTLAEAYLDFVNNYVSTSAFAEAHGLTTRQAALVIETGREIHEARVAASATPKSYTVVAVSSNANSFGYKSVLCLAEDGEGLQFLVQAYGTDKVPARGDVVRKDESRWFGAPHPLKKVTEKEAKKILADVRKG